jgi:hypothetical protein
LPHLAFVDDNNYRTPILDKVIGVGFQPVVTAKIPTGTKYPQTLAKNPGLVFVFVFVRHRYAISFKGGARAGRSCT